MERISKAKKEKARSAYEEGGRAIGRQVLHDPMAEERIWKMVSGLKIWPKWFLLAFARLYAEEHPAEYEKIRKRRYRKRNRQETIKAKLAAALREATEGLQGKD